MTNHPRIAIIGSGLAGLTLALVLQNHGVLATVFEKDTSADNRSQGGCLDMHPESGQRAIEIAGVIEQFRAIMRIEGQDYKMIDKDGKVLMDIVSSADNESRPEADRGPLRMIFINKLKESIRWGSHVENVVPIKDRDGYKINFTDKTSEEFDIVIGADGSFSRVRPFLSSAQATHSGVVFVEMYLSDADRKHPALARTVGNGVYGCFAESKGILAQRNGDGRIRVYAALKVDENWAHQNGVEAYRSAKVARERLLVYFIGWHQSLLDLILQSDDDFFWPRNLYALPVGHDWEHKRGITLIGDAAHVMVPFSGKGANMAMLDGAELGLALVAGLRAGDVYKAIEDFERKMIARATECTRESADQMDKCMGPTGAEHILKYRQESMAAGNHTDRYH
jgi:2-polyprenyl-6-methoxyphenol hydroxylase-like FAD-dependent oxidoreductase